MIVMKFGGTSVGSVDAVAQVAQIVRKHVQDRPLSRYPGVIVVTSAMSGVTNMLIEMAKQAAAGDVPPDIADNLNAITEVQQALRAKHQEVIQHFIADEEEHKYLHKILDMRLEEFRRLCESVMVLGELTAQGLDVISGLGERMSAPILAGVLRAEGVSAKFIDAAELIVTDNIHNGAEPLMDQTREQCREILLPLFENGETSDVLDSTRNVDMSPDKDLCKNRAPQSVSDREVVVPVVTGFVGRSIDGAPTTFGRGGSDYSAAIIGAVIDADEIQIWTDVDGVLTADPRVVPNARSLQTLTYEEVGELTYYGAKVLHPKTVMPAIDRQIPVRVLNTFNPGHPGTKIVCRHGKDGIGIVKAVTAIGDMSLITVGGRGLIGILGMAARTFESVAKARANVLMISQSSSEQNICFVIPTVDANRVVQTLREELSRELENHNVEHVAHLSKIVIVAVVGSGMRGVPGVAAKIFTALGQHRINVIAIAQGSSEANISIVIDEADVEKALIAIHDAFELHKPTGERAISEGGS